MYEKIEHFYPRAIKVIQPESEFKIKTDGSIIFLNGTAPIAENLIHEKAIELKTEYDNKKYQRDRKVEYDKLNQFELIGEDSINGTTNHRDAIIAIKDKYPKE